jgi:hypothetical protein
MRASSDWGTGGEADELREVELDCGGEEVQTGGRDRRKDKGMETEREEDADDNASEEIR